MQPWAGRHPHGWLVCREFHSLDAAWRVIRPDTTSMDVETLLDVLQHGKALNRWARCRSRSPMTTSLISKPHLLPCTRTATRRTLTFAVEQLDVAEYFPGMWRE